MNSNLEQKDNPSFFKFLVDDSVDCLPICPAFVKKFLEGKYPKNPITIVTESEESWGVEIARIGLNRKHCFVNGWLQFMKDNLLERGDFLVFWLIADSTFQVTMYGPSCCEKGSNLRGNDKRRNISSQARMKKKPKVEKELSDGSAEPESPALAMQQPWCSRVMMESHKYNMPLTSRFWRETRIGSKKSVVLRDAEEREWKVWVKEKNSGYYITRGWFYFQRANQVQVGDTCVFTLNLITPPPRPPRLNLIIDVKVVRKAKRKRGRPRASSTKTAI